MLCSLVHGRGVPGRAAGAAVPVVYRAGTSAG